MTSKLPGEKAGLSLTIIPALPGGAEIEIEFLAALPGTNRDGVPAATGEDNGFVSTLAAEKAISGAMLFDGDAENADFVLDIYLLARAEMYRLPSEVYSMRAFVSRLLEPPTRNHEANDSSGSIRTA